MMNHETPNIPELAMMSVCTVFKVSRQSIQTNRGTVYHNRARTALAAILHENGLTHQAVAEILHCSRVNVTKLIKTAAVLAGCSRPFAVRLDRCRMMMSAGLAAQSTPI